MIEVRMNQQDVGGTKGKVVLITGASLGLGQAVMQRLVKEGYKVYGTSRSDQGRPDFLKMDVTEDASVEQAVKSLMEKEGRIDVLINNAGMGISGSIEDTPMAAIEKQMATNFFGTVRVCKQVIPIMRQSGAGRIINVTSLAGVVALPFQTMYSASKFAAEGFSEGLRYELMPFGIFVSVVQPGDFKTDFTANRQKLNSSPPYAKPCEQSLAVMERDEQNGKDPSMVGDCIIRILTSPKPRLRYSVGRFDQRLGVKLKSYLPQNAFESIIASTYKLQS